jgi:hypothetical protein
MRTTATKPAADQGFQGCVLLTLFTLTACDLFETMHEGPIPRLAQI